MLLVIDVGNTNTVMGVYAKQELRASWRLRTERHSTADELGVLVSSLFRAARIPMDHIRQTVISCVVPPLVNSLHEFCQHYFGHAPLWVEAKSYPRMPLKVVNPSEVGADRIVNAVGAFEKFNSALIVIDFGTATTFDIISARGEYLGGAIAPGLKISAEALFMKASKLPRVEIFAPPEKVIGQTTIDSIRSGLIYGYAGLVDGMVGRLKTEIAGDVKVIATGGLAGLIAEVSRSIEAVEPDLTLEGLRIIGNYCASPQTG